MPERRQLTAVGGGVVAETASTADSPPAFTPRMGYWQPSRDRYLRRLVMPPRPTWKGYLKVSLVNIPVKVYPATESSATISFNRIQRMPDPDQPEEVVFKV